MFVNTDVELECDVYAVPRPTVSWYKDGGLVTLGDYFHMVDRRNLRLLGLLVTDSGMYQCFATNHVGTIQSAAQLFVRQRGESF